MGNKLITFKEIQEMYRAGVREINLTQNKLLSPGAKDFALERGIKLVYENKDMKKLNTEPVQDSPEQIKEQIIRILQRDFKNMEAERIEEITARVMKALETILT